MKIACIYDAVYPWVKGGVEKRIYELARRLVARGNEVHWYGVGWWLKHLNNNTIEHDGIVLHGVCSPIELYTNSRRSIGAAIHFASKLLPQLMREKFDAVDCQEFPYFSCFTAKFCSVTLRSSLVITWHEIWTDYWYEYLGVKGIFGKITEEMTTKLTDNNVAVSERTKRDLELKVDNVAVIPNGIDFEWIQKVKKTDNESDIIFVGRLICEKNVDVLLRAVKLLKKDVMDVRCIIIGDGPERKKLEKIARDSALGGNVKFLGFLENYDDVISYMKASKVFVLPSVREGFGIAALEANACGLPVVTVDHKRNATGDLIKTGVNGFLCRLSEKEMAQRIVEAVDSDMADKCAKKARKFDWGVITEKYVRFLKGIV